jgi:N-acetylated-alpha-linked acidic dipeptidase
MADLETATKLFAELRTGNTKPNTNIMILNKTLFQAEQKLTVQQGLPLRPWFRHTIYAPGLYTGYGVKTLPGIREAIEERRWTEAQEQIEIVTKAIVEYTTEVSAASKLLMMR